VQERCDVPVHDRERIAGEYVLAKCRRFKPCAEEDDEITQRPSTPTKSIKQSNIASPKLR
jgi:hypothetical protein